MIEQLAWKLVFLIACLPLFLLIGATSLSYNIFKFDYSPEAIKVFLKSLPFPLNTLYGSNDQDALAYKNQATGRDNFLGRLIFSVGPCSMIISLFLDAISKNTNALNIISNFLLIVLISRALLSAWRFGNYLDKKFVS